MDGLKRMSCGRGPWRRGLRYQAFVPAKIGHPDTYLENNLQEQLETTNIFIVYMRL